MSMYGNDGCDMMDSIFLKLIELKLSNMLIANVNQCSIPYAAKNARTTNTIAAQKRLQSNLASISQAPREMLCLPSCFSQWLW